FFPFLSGCVASWALAVSLIIHKQSTTPARFPRAVLACNVLGPTVPLVYVAILLGISMPGGRAYRSLVHQTLALERQFLARAPTWQVGDRIGRADLAWAVPLLVSQAATFRRFSHIFSRVFIYYGVTALLLVVTLSSIAGTYFWTVRKSLNDARRGSTVPASPGSPNMKLISTIAHQQRRVRRMLVNLFATFFLFITLGVVFSASALIAAIDPHALVRSNKSAQVLTFLPLYGFAVLGIPCMVLVLASAKRAVPAHDADGRVSYAFSPPAFGTPFGSPRAGPGGHAHDGGGGGGDAAQTVELEALARSGKASAPQRFKQWFRQPERSDARASAVSYTVDVDVVVDAPEYEQKHAPQVRGNYPYPTE
ncbi:hypothetical protein JCM3774_003596, partial [Rhodotorula dairenensis]